MCRIEYGLWSKEDKIIKPEDSRPILTVKRKKINFLLQFREIVDI